MQLQLENSLFLVNLTRGAFFLEPISLRDRVDTLRHHWPDLLITQSGDGTIMADVRALESVLTNLVQNSVTHGQASEVDVIVKRNDNGRLIVRVSDNGHGFHGDLNRLGKLFVRHTRGSGSGVGLYIVRQLMKRMNGAISFADASTSGFVAEIDFPNAGTSDSIRSGQASYEATVAGRR